MLEGESAIGTSPTLIRRLLAALAATAARVAWICNLQAELGATANMSARRHLSMLRRHGVRVDAVLYDPEAELAFAPDELARQGVEGLPFPLQGARRGVHDPELLRAALTELRAEHPATSRAVG